MSAVIQTNHETLPALVDRASKILASAKSAAEVLEARDVATLAYDVAKSTARLARAKDAHDELIHKVYRAQADALMIEAQAKTRLADEYDAAQKRGEVRAPSERTTSNPEAVGASDAGLTHKDLHEARIIRDAEQADPGIVQRTVEEAVKQGQEPTKAKVRRAVLETARPNQAQARPSRGKDAICLRVRDAVQALSGLPPAPEVAAYFAGTDGAVIINEHITQANEWLSEFASTWSALNAD